MAMAMMTYAKMEIFRNFTLLESQFTNYMEETERSSINQTAEKWYRTVKASTKGGTQKTPSQSSSRLSFAVFTDSKLQNTKEYPQIRHLAKKLIHILYQGSPFYQKMMQTRPDFVDNVLNRLILADKLQDKQKIVFARDLANLKLGDAVLDDVFYKMLKGTQKTSDTSKAASSAKQNLVQMEFQLPETQAEDEDEAPDANLKEEHISPAGYYSLLDYITLDKKHLKVRVFLASRPLLLAIFDDPQAVDQVIEYRRQLYQELMRGGRPAAEATALFKNQFAARADKNIDDTILDFGVSKTNPKNYE